ncbi:MAG: FtsX-like permease family protein, partial [Acidimicrobiales bacterium]
APDGSGEVLVSGDMVFAGYVDDADGSAAKLRDGWLRTGDVGTLDGEGLLRIVDRRADLIVSGGENVYPAELEAVLAGHAAVSDVAVDAVEGVDGIDHVEVVAQIDATVEREGSSFATSLSGYEADTRVHGFPDGLPAAGVLAGQGLADQIGVSVGDDVRIELPTLDVELTTTVEGFLDEPLGSFLYMDAAQLETIVGAETLGSPSVSSLATLFSDEVADRDAVVDDLKELDEVGIALDSRTMYDLMQSFLGFFYVFIGIMLVFGGAMAFALMYNTISVNVAERSGEFATMRANGLSHAGIARLIATENILLTVMGIVPGLIVGYLVGALFMSQFSVDAFTLSFQMKASSIVLCALAMLVVAGLSLIPAIRTVRRLDIGEVVRERAA